MGSFMSKIVAVVNMKGGIGKTTVAVAFAEASSFMGRKTLVIDLDLQINASISLVGNCDDHFLPWRRHHTIENYLENRWQGSTPDPHIYFLQFGLPHLISGSPSLTIFERRLLITCNNVYQAKCHMSQWMNEILDAAKKHFDLIICDTPPGLSLLAEAVIRSADQIVVPQVPDRLSTQGLQLYSRYLRDELQLPNIAERTSVFINRFNRAQTVSKNYAEQILLDARRPVFPYTCFSNRFSESVTYKRAMDRSELGDLRAVQFRQLWGAASDEVIAATRELWTYLGWIEDDEADDDLGNRREFSSDFRYI
jgi:chromosome partitioning protein